MARKKMEVFAGNPVLHGVTKVTEGYNFSAYVPEDAEGALLLYKKKGKLPVKEISLTDDFRNGEICSVLLPDFQAEKFEYNYRIDGKILQDPYAYRICGRDDFGSMPDDTNEHVLRCGFLAEEEFDWEGDRPLQNSMEDMILYKLHVRGFTKQAKIPAKIRGTLAGLKEMIPYFQDLGINAVELMPVYDFAEISKEEVPAGLVQRKNEKKNINYWGYLPGFYQAVKKSYCASENPENEMRELVKALHKAGIECILEMYFPKDVNAMQAVKVLQFWKLYYHADGFHLLGEGVSKELFLQDEILKGTKIFTDWFSEEDLKYASGKRKNLADYNGKFMETMRSFLKSDAGRSKEAAAVLTENYKKKTVVNYMASQNGFTLNDMVSYNEKHNEDNGHKNSDGMEENFSWNCGEEGKTSKKSVQELREKQLRNAFAMLLFAQGIPCIYAGDEFGNSQEGNNNAYCQDNPTGWLDWKDLKKNSWLYCYVKELIAFRKKHPVLHSPKPLTGSDYQAKGMPDISFHGTKAWDIRFEKSDRLLGTMYCGDYVKKEDGTCDDTIYIGYNFHWNSRELALPILSGNRKWKKTADTSKSVFGGESGEEFEKKIEVSPRTIVVLTGNGEA